MIVSSIEKEFQIIKEIIRSLSKIHIEQNWHPRRTIIFCLCHESANDCYHELSDYVQTKIIAFITHETVENNFTNINNYLLSNENCLHITGSNIAATAVQRAVDFVKLSNSFNTCNNEQFYSSKEINIPQAIISFVVSRGKRIFLFNI